MTPHSEHHNEDTTAKSSMSQYSNISPLVRKQYSEHQQSKHSNLDITAVRTSVRIHLSEYSCQNSTYTAVKTPQHSGYKRQIMNAPVHQYLHSSQNAAVIIQQFQYSIQNTTFSEVITVLKQFYMWTQQQNTAVRMSVRPLFFPLSFISVYQICIDCFCFPLQYQSYEVFCCLLIWLCAP